MFDPPVSEAEYAQAYTWAMTRDFTVHGEDDERAAILPIADFINHRNTPENVQLIETDDGGFEIQATIGMRAGSELTLRYGDLGNGDLLTYWGFIIRDNEHDVVNLDVVIPQTDPLRADKERIIAEFRSHLTTKPKDASDMLRILRLLSSNVRQSFDDVGVRGYMTGMMRGTPTEELAALAFAVSQCEGMMTRLGVAGENAPLVAKTTELSDNLKLIIAYRQELRRVLEKLRNKFEGMETKGSTGAKPMGGEEEEGGEDDDEEEEEEVAFNKMEFEMPDPLAHEEVEVATE